MPYDEEEANKALAEAIRAIRTAEERCAMAGYGSMIMAPLDDALKAVKYALDVAEGRA